MIRLKMTELKFYTNAFAMTKSFKMSEFTVEPDSYGGLIFRAKVEPALLTLALSKHLVNVFVEITEIKRHVQYFVQY